ncbi:NACHT domain-containing protein [Actinokineospora fastidiosa]|uniref:NACHT domain-containing protein n=1 Tax=Actinokineospora fastidiosa TaxID=1816 RepID=UPI00166F8AA1|nr:NACHT domain-containing protein [Actinokineospora fastidiosa]
MRRSAVWRKVRVVSVVVFCVAVAAILLLFLPDGELDRGDKVASVISMVTACVTLVTMLISAPPQEKRPVAPGAVADVLANAVRAQWETEERIRRVHDPFPLPFRWSVVDDETTDHWQNINRAHDDDSPLDLAGRDDVVAVFRRVPSGRLVVLGAAGAGKTILASRFTLPLLDQRAPGDPVPVIFPLGSWDPMSAPLRDWLAEQLIADYPMLSAADDSGGTLAARLLADRLVLPVLDGLDEVPEGIRGAVVTRINRGVLPGDRFLLTSRPDEFRAAAADPLASAAVVRLDRLTIDDVAGYLPLTTRKGRDTRTKWHPVLAHARRSGIDSALSEVLSTPLMVALARAVFSDTAADPARLLAVSSPDTRTTRELIEDRLLAGFVPAVYSDDLTEATAARARRHLAFLARHSLRLRTQDIAWWRLVTAVPRTVVGAVAGLVITAATWLGAGFPGWAGHWPDGGGRQAWLVATLIAGAATGLAGGLIVGQGRGIRLTPARVRLRMRGRARQIGARLLRSLTTWRNLAWFAVWTVGGLLFGVVASLSGRDGGVLLVGLAAGLFCGAALWFVVSFVRALGVPVTPTETTSPADLLRTDRRTALRQGLAVGVGGSAVFWLMLRLAMEPAFGTPFAVVFPGGLWVLGTATMAVLGLLIWMLFVTVWGPWLVARTWLSLTGKLPWPVMGFLVDAHRRGVLRQAGGVYQFRHARLRDHLAG